MEERNEKSLQFLRSAMTEENPFISTNEVLRWIAERNSAIDVKVNKVKFSELKKWEFDSINSSLRHESGKFFSIDGIRVNTNYGNLQEWEQPIINQPEIGYLGFMTKEFNGILYFLVQAKIEPGNVNNVQLSPTLQATKSNYSKVHNGKAPLYFDFFRDRNRCEILLDQLQSEQGARFLHKRNRNIIIKTDDEVLIHDDFIWLTLGQLKKLMQVDNVVNMDTRTVLSAIQFGGLSSEVVSYLKVIEGGNSVKLDMLVSALKNEYSKQTIDEILAWITQLKCSYDLFVDSTPLNMIKDWEIGESEIFHKDHRFFSVIAAHVEIGNREVASWYQPLIKPSQEGLIVFIIKKINNVLHFLVQAKLECGNFDILELAPTVQCLTGNYRETAEGKLPFLDYVLSAPEENIIIDTLQSEEGGRFYREQNRNMIIIADEDFDENVPDRYSWMTLHQLQSFMKYNNYLNIQARSLISAISFI